MALDPIEEYAQPYKEPRLELNPEKSKDFMTICCPSCDSDIDAEDINIHDKIGKCLDCNIVFPFGKALLNLETTPQKIRQEILRPDGIDLFYFNNSLEITTEQPYPWIEWVVSIVGLLVMIGASVGISEGSMSAAFILVGLVLSNVFYYYHRKKKHKIFLTIDEENLNIEWQPKKFNKEKNYRSKDIVQLYIKHKPDLGIWRIMMIINEGNGHKHIKLTSANSISKAKFLEQEIEKHLKIQDIEIPEETK